MFHISFGRNAMGFAKNGYGFIAWHPDFYIIKRNPFTGKHHTPGQ